MTHTCPRRREMGMDRDDGPFRGAGSNLDTYEGNCCSYCGSLDPDVLMARLEAGTLELGPTDKSYKVYVTPTPGSAPCESVKFYFQHLSEAQMQRFIDLLNEGKLKFGFPGYLYTRPFFIAAPRA